MSKKNIRKINHKPTLDAALSVLQSETESIKSDVYYGLSGLSEADMARFADVWHGLPDDRRYRVASSLADATESDFELDYRSIGLYMLNDSNADVRIAAIEMLWEDETLETMYAFMRLARQDADIRVRSTAAGATALGRFVLLGEYGEIPFDAFESLQALLVSLLKDDTLDTEIRRRALEAISNSSHEIVPIEIRKAYRSHDHHMKVSALFAMGRSADSVWEDIVLKELDNDDAEMRYEATRAAGEIGIMEAVPKLGRLLIDDDREIQMNAIWSLGEIGGKEAQRILEAVRDVAEEADDEDLLEAIDDALANVSFADGGVFGWYDDK
jgi:HEAT repeat protein